MHSDPLFEVRFREFEAALKELNERIEVERDEWQRKLNAEQLEWSEWERRFDAGVEEMSRKYKAEVEELRRRREAEKEPFQMHQVTVSSIPRVPIQKVISLHVAPKKTALKVQVKVTIRGPSLSENMSAVPDVTML